MCVLLTGKQCYASVTGTVRDTTGIPVEGALITFIDESNAQNIFSTYTDMSGKYEVFLWKVVVDEDSPVLLHLGQNYPNPFNPSTTIPFSLDRPGNVELKVFNILGQEIRLLTKGYYHAGYHKLIWDGIDDNGNTVSAGVYIYRLISAGKVLIGKMLLIDGGARSVSSFFPKPGLIRINNLKLMKSANTKSFLVTITGEDIEPYAQNNVVVEDGDIYDFTVQWKKTEYNGITFTTIPAGTFMMGNLQGDDTDHDRPAHEVTLDKFEISVYEVTQNQYRSVMGENPSHFTGDDYQPVDTVSWFEAAQFCNLLSDIVGFERCYSEETFECDFLKNGFRMPTEAEWEYACKSGTSMNYSFGNNIYDLSEFGWYYVNSGDKSLSFGEADITEAEKNNCRTHPVGEKKPNYWDLYDMHGNVSEWCNDWYGYYYYGNNPGYNPTGPESGNSRVLRGGNWLSPSNECRSYYRQADDPGSKSNEYGFRVVRGCSYETDDTYIVKGRIVANDLGIGNVSVRILGVTIDETKITDSTGNYTTHGYTNGKYTIIPSLEGYVFSPPRVKIKIINNDVTVGDIVALKYTNGMSTEMIRFVQIPSGYFMMGSNYEDNPDNPYKGEGYSEDERPVHQVTVDEFEMSVYEITNRIYAAFLNVAIKKGDITVSEGKVYGLSGAYQGQEYIDLHLLSSEINFIDSEFRVKEGRENHPVVKVTWFGAKSFALYCDCDLPREAEWEYACRAGTSTRYYNGDSESDLARAAWYGENSGIPGVYTCTHPVGLREPNAWGLYDMLGNVLEWCNDWYDENYYKKQIRLNPIGPGTGRYRILHGGSWGFNAVFNRIADRFYDVPEQHNHFRGFRIVQR